MLYKLLFQTLILFLKHNTLKSYTDLSEMTIGMLSKLTCIEPSGYTAARLDEAACIEKIDNVCHLAYLVGVSLCYYTRFTSLCLLYYMQQLVCLFLGLAHAV